MKRTGKENGDTKGFVSGVFLLSASTLIVKIIGLAYKIPMIELLGAVGMGYFNSAYEIYATLCVISTAGLPVALSMLVSSRIQNRNGYGVRRIYRWAFALFLLIGAVGSLAMAVFAEEISLYIENPDARACITAISPSLVCVCAASAVRGYYQGMGRMMPTAASQLIEALSKLVFGVIFATYALRRGYSIALSAAYAVLGLSLGTLLSALFLIIYKAADGGDKRKTSVDGRVADGEERGILKRLFAIAVPITLGSAVLSVTRLIDMTLIMKRLGDVGYTSYEVNEIYGAYTTLSLPVFSLIPSLVAPISLALIPRLSAAVDSKNAEGQSAVVRSAMRLTTLFAMPASVGVAVYAERILGLLFKNQREAVDIASPLLAVLGISVLFSCVITTTNAILQAYSKTVKPIISMAVGAVVKIVLAYYLLGNPDIAIWGAPISTLACDVVITAINIYYVNKYVPRTDGISRLYVRPFAASLAMMAVSFSAYLLVLRAVGSASIAFLVAMAAALPAYLLFAAVFGALEEGDLADIPLGEKVLFVSRKLGLFDKDKNTENISAELPSERKIKWK